MTLRPPVWLPGAPRLAPQEVRAVPRQSGAPTPTQYAAQKLVPQCLQVANCPPSRSLVRVAKLLADACKFDIRVERVGLRVQRRKALRRGCVLHRVSWLGARVQGGTLHRLHLRVFVVPPHKQSIFDKAGECIADATVLGLPTDHFGNCCESHLTVAYPGKDFLAQLCPD